MFSAPQIQTWEDPMTLPTFEPLLPSSLWLALALAALTLLIIYAFRRPPAIPRPRWALTVALMSLSLLSVLLILLNPTWVERTPPPAAKPALTILVDATASMATPDATGGVPRFVAAAQTTARAADRLAKKFDVRVKPFTDTLASADARSLENKQPTGMTTDLAGALAA